MNTANLRRLLDKATPRPWNMRHRHCSGPGEPTPDVDEIAGLGWDWDDESPYNTPPEPMRGVLSRGADAALIVELVNSADELLAEIANLRAANDMLAEYAKSIRHDYTELLYAVGKRYPDETRHETALRYIRQADAPQNDMCKDEALEQQL